MKKDNVLKFVLYAILIAYGLITLYPFLWAVGAGFRNYRDIVAGGLNIFPTEPTIDNFRFIFFEHPMFTRWVFNSFFISGVGTAVNIILNTMAGYALARLSFPGRKPMFLIIIGVIAIPGQILLIPNFLIMRSIGLLDSYGALILPGAINFSYIFMMRQFFLNFPTEVEEAAKIDGCNGVKSFIYIVFPMAKASIATMGVFVFLSFWNEFLRPLLYLSTPQNFPITLGLRTFQDQNAAQWNYIMAASVVSILPIVILYVVLNKYFMQGFRMGGDK